MLDPIHKQTIIASGAYPHLNNDILIEKCEHLKYQRMFITRRFLWSTISVVMMSFILFILKLVYERGLFPGWVFFLFGFAFIAAIIMVVSAVDLMENYFHLRDLTHEARRRGITEFEA